MDCNSEDSDIVFEEPDFKLWGETEMESGSTKSKLEPGTGRAEIRTLRVRHGLAVSSRDEANSVRDCLRLQVPHVFVPGRS